MELWDAYDKDGNLTGDTLVRGGEVADGLYHIVVGILVQHVDGTYLLMHRDPRKETFPDVYEASAGGSALKGEDALQAARRELLEETGVTAGELTPLYEEISHKGHCLYRGFLCVTDCDKQSITLQEGETVGFLWADRDEVERLTTKTTPTRCVLQTGVRAYLGIGGKGIGEESKLLLPPKYECRY